MKGLELKELRVKNGISQQKLASLLEVSVRTVINYENSANISPITATAILSIFEKIADGSEMPEISHKATPKQQAIELIEAPVMEIPLVSQYAYAGYLDGYQDTTYMTDLPKVPFNVDHYGRGKYLAFEVRGDSMTDGTHQSILNGDILMCREVYQDHWKSKLHINKWTFVIVHRTEGVIIKKIIDHDVEKGIITIHSLNPDYPDQEINLADVKQLFNVLRVDRKM